MEHAELIIVKASQLLLCMHADQDKADHSTTYSVRLRPEGVKLLSRLVESNQLVLLMDVVGEREVHWIKDYLVDTLRIHVDAIYAFANETHPSDYLVDIS